VRRFFVFAALLSVACGGPSPTSPESAGALGSDSVEAHATEHRARPSPRVVQPRPPSQTAVAPGIWGGEHVGLLVTDRGGSLEYDCAHGKIGQALVTDAAGRFDLRGTHTREHGGPIREDEVADTHPARYSGTTDGRTMILTVTLSDSGERIGTFELTRGRNGWILRCL
jgi:hypothetical protein